MNVEKSGDRKYFHPINKILMMRDVFKLQNECFLLCLKGGRMKISMVSDTFKLKNVCLLLTENQEKQESGKIDGKIVD
jgi:hypothetical protein